MLGILQIGSTWQWHYYSTSCAKSYGSCGRRRMFRRHKKPCLFCVCHPYRLSLAIALVLVGGLGTHVALSPCATRRAVRGCWCAHQPPSFSRVFTTAGAVSLVTKSRPLKSERMVCLGRTVHMQEASLTRAHTQPHPHPHMHILQSIRPCRRGVHVHEDLFKMYTGSSSPHILSFGQNFLSLSCSDA